MTTLALTTLLQNTPRLLAQVLGHLNAFLDGLDDARVLAHRYETLARLSDAELAHRGLKRHDIPRVVLADLRRD
jgi:hypothetical protein